MPRLLVLTVSIGASAAQKGLEQGALQHFWDHTAHRWRCLGHCYSHWPVDLDVHNRQVREPSDEDPMRARGKPVESCVGRFGRRGSCRRPRTGRVDLRLARL